MFHSTITAEGDDAPFGGILAAMNKAREVNPTMQALPKGFTEHTESADTANEETPLIFRRAAR